jgi:uncharacterized protein YecT (DUF1311 family)
MPQVNLSTVTGQELRQLLDSSRRRGDAALTYKILQEMAARREAAAEGGPRLKRRPAGARVVAIELGEPPETDDVPPMPHWRPPVLEPQDPASPPAEPAAALGRPQRRSRRTMRPARTPAAAAAPVVAAPVEPPPPPETGPPLSLRDADPEPPPEEAAGTQDRDLRLRPAEPERLRPPRRHFLRDVAGFAAGVTLGIALGWWGGRIGRDVLWPSAAPAAAPIRTAALTPRPALVPATQAASAAEPTPAPETPPDAAVGPPPSAQEPAAQADSAAMESSPPPPAPRATEAVKTADTAQPASDRPAAVVAKGCAAEPTPADREICGDPDLRRLQRELQRAYAEALQAHQDRTLLRERQLAWRDARNTVSDPDRLARLYEQRIRKLNAATAEARQQR